MPDLDDIELHFLDNGAGRALLDQLQQKRVAALDRLRAGEQPFVVVSRVADCVDEAADGVDCIDLLDARTAIAHYIDRSDHPPMLAFDSFMQAADRAGLTPVLLDVQLD